MRKIITFLFASMMALTLVGCGSTEPADDYVAPVTDDIQEVVEEVVVGSTNEIPQALVVEYLGFEPDVDYRSDIVMACMLGDYENGVVAVQAYNAKNEWLGLEIQEIDFHNLYLVAKIIFKEAGSSWLSDEHQQGVASVLVNRADSPEFPDSIEECVYQKGQYPKTSGSYFKELLPDERSVKNALYVLEYGSIAPPAVVFQAEFRQGSGVWKEIPDKYLGTTYFCYSSHPELYESEVDGK